MANTACKADASNMVGAQLESSLPEESRHRIFRILESVHSLTDVEKLLLYIKLPCGTHRNVDCDTAAPTGVVSGSNLSAAMNSSVLHLSNQLEQSQAYTWIMSHLEEDKNTCLRKNEVYDDYKSYCESHGLKSLTTADFGKVMKRSFPNVKPRRLGQRGQSKYCYGGLRKKLEVQPPSLPNLSHDATVLEEKCRTDSNTRELEMHCAEIVLEWADRIIGTQFVTLRELAEHLVSNMYVNSRSKAAFSLIAVMHGAIAATGNGANPAIQNCTKVSVTQLFNSKVINSKGNINPSEELQHSLSNPQTPKRIVNIKTEHSLSPPKSFIPQLSQAQQVQAYLLSPHCQQAKFHQTPQQSPHYTAFTAASKVGGQHLPQNVLAAENAFRTSLPASPHSMSAPVTHVYSNVPPLTPTGVHQHRHAMEPSHHSWIASTTTPSHHHHQTLHQYSVAPPHAHTPQQVFQPPRHNFANVPAPIGMSAMPYAPLSAKRPPPGYYEDTSSTAAIYSSCSKVSPVKRLRRITGAGNNGYNSLTSGINVDTIEHEEDELVLHRFSYPTPLGQPNCGYHTGLLSPGPAELNSYPATENCSPLPNWYSAATSEESCSAAVTGSFSHGLPAQKRSSLFSSGRDSPCGQHRLFTSPIHIPNSHSSFSDHYDHLSGAPQFPPVSPTGFLSSLTPSLVHASSDLPRIGMSPQPAISAVSTQKNSPLRIVLSPCRSSSTSMNPSSPQTPFGSDTGSPATAGPVLQQNLRHAGPRSPFVLVPRKLKVKDTLGITSSESMSSRIYHANTPEEYTVTSTTSDSVTSLANEARECHQHYHFHQHDQEVDRKELNTPTPPTIGVNNCSPEFITSINSVATKAINQ